MNFVKKPFIRNNEALKAPDHVEYISKEEAEDRIKEIIQCKQDPIYFAQKYFTIITPGIGKHIIKMFPKQIDLVRMMCNEDRVVVLAARQSGKTVSYSIFALWSTIFCEDKKVLICAQRRDNALEFLSKIQLAYELLPSWIKPGIIEWNKGKAEFSNGSSIQGISTSDNAGRGMAIDILVMDEFAFIENAEDFWTGTYPVISSNKGTKVILVSTPNGVGNLFYKIWDAAELGIDSDGFKAFKMDWWDRPGRDEEWKRKQLSSIGDRGFAQEFGNSFLGSSYTLIEAATLKELRDKTLRNEKEPETYLIDNFDKFKLNVWERPSKNKTYVIGADVAEGIGGDYSVILVFNVCDVTKIKCVASFAANNIPTDEFSYVLAKIHRMYHDALICMECNSIGRAVFDSLINNYEVDNFLKYGSRDPTKHGIFSHNATKSFACLWLKNLLSIKEISVDISEKRIIHELEFFEKKKGLSLKSTFAATAGNHDDFVMSFIWAILALNPTLVENYLVVDKFMKTERGFLLPHILKNVDAGYYKESVDGFDSDSFKELNSETYVPKNLQKVEKHEIEESPDDEGEDPAFVGLISGDQQGVAAGVDEADWDKSKSW